MKRIEVVANQSLKAELLDLLEARLPDIEYTLLSLVQGKGLRKRKEGTRVWPETNVCIIMYVGDGALEEIAKIILKVKAKFPDEGLFAAVSDAVEVKG